MKAISYDAEGDILSVSFTEVTEQKQTGVELNDNIVLYFNPETEQPLALILSSYQAMREASAQTPLLLEGLSEIPSTMQAIILKLLQRTPLSDFLQLVEIPAKAPPTSRIHEVFSPAILRTIAAN